MYVCKLNARIMQVHYVITNWQLQIAVYCC